MSAVINHPRVGDWVQTRSGRAYWPMNPRAAEVDIDDIAHSLSMICRFGGHTRFFYSVAEHSVLVSQCVPPEHALQALLHDATEAYVGDMVRPLKQSMPGYCDIEDKNWLVIAEKFGVPAQMHESIKAADNAVLLAEKAALLEASPIPWTWADGIEAANVPIVGYAPAIARGKFIARFAELVASR